MSGHKDVVRQGARFVGGGNVGRLVDDAALRQLRIASLQILSGIDQQDVISGVGQRQGCGTTRDARSDDKNLSMTTNGGIHAVDHADLLFHGVSLRDALRRGAAFRRRRRGASGRKRQGDGALYRIFGERSGASGGRNLPPEKERMFSCRRAACDRAWRGRERQGRDRRAGERRCRFPRQSGCRADDGA